jgi:hypothetical protein
MPTTMATSTEAPAGIASEAAVPAEPSPSPSFAAEEGTAQELDVVSATVDVPTADTNADTNPPTSTSTQPAASTKESIRKNVFKDKQSDIKKEWDALLLEKYTPTSKTKAADAYEHYHKVTIKDSMVSAIANYLSCYIIYIITNLKRFRLRATHLCLNVTG